MQFWFCFNLFAVLFDYISIHENRRVDFKVFGQREEISGHQREGVAFDESIKFSDKL